jgi:NADH-quinone oxidoreductase subunit N
MVFYFDVPAAEAALIDAGGVVRAVLSLNGAAILVFGILPGGLLAVCAQAIQRALAT